MLSATDPASNDFQRVKGDGCFISVELDELGRRVGCRRDFGTIVWRHANEDK